MRIIIVRHATAEASSPSGSDEDRKLTDEGRKEAELLGKLLGATIPPPEDVWTSPLVRCRETTELALRSMKHPQAPRSVQALAPGADPEKLSHMLSEAGVGSLMLCGHAPDVGLLASHLLGFASEHRLAKGAVCILEVDDPMRPPGRSVATLEPGQYPAILRGESYAPWMRSKLKV